MRCRNTTYLVEYGPSHQKAVLRLGPVNRHLIMGFEENLNETPKGQLLQHISRF